MSSPVLRPSASSKTARANGSSTRERSLDIGRDYQVCNLAWTVGLVTFLSLPLVVSAGWWGAHGLVCVVRAQTGLPCGGCGITRSVLTLYTAGLAASRVLHPAGVWVVAMALLQLALRPLIHRFGRRFVWVPWLDLAQIAACAAGLGAAVTASGRFSG